MKRLRLIYEQLDEAKTYLLRGSLLNLRLALILADNAAELLMFNVLENKFSRDEWLRPLRKNYEKLGLPLDPVLQPKYSDEERARAEKEFEPMVLLLQHRLSQLSPSDATVLRISHRLRRDAFHRGQLREDILGPIVRLLFTTVVRLTESLRLGTVVMEFPLDEDDKVFLRRFGMEEAFLSYSEETRNTFSTKLLEGAEFDMVSFRIALTEDMVGRTEALLNQLSAFYDDDRQKNEELFRYQFWQENAAQDERPQGSTFDAAFATWQTNASPLVTVEWLRRFKASVRRKLQSQHPSQVLAGYWGLEKDFAAKEDFVERHVAAVDSAIQLELDIARGK
jgi:hypothetical protein